MSNCTCHCHHTPRERENFPRADAAFFLGISLRTLDEFDRLGKIRARWIGKKKVYGRGELQRFAKAHHASPFASTTEALVEAPVAGALEAA